MKWIKLATGLPDNRKMKQIRRLPDGDTIALMWVFLMCLAGETNDDGMVYFTPEIPFTEEMLSEQFSMEIDTIRQGLKLFQRFGMIEMVDEMIRLPSWEKWQAVDKLSAIREQTRKRVAKHREKQAVTAGNVTCNVTVTESNAIDKIRIEEDKKKNRGEYQLIADMYNTICTSLPTIRSLSDARKKAIGARLKTYTVEEIRTVFENAEASSFLKGRNSRNWTATFDWLMKDSNMAKVLDGNYADKGTAEERQPTPHSNAALDYYNQLMAGQEDGAGDIT